MPYTVTRRFRVAPPSFGGGAETPWVVHARFICNGRIELGGACAGHADVEAVSERHMIVVPAGTDAPATAMADDSRHRSARWRLRQPRSPRRRRFSRWSSCSDATRRCVELLRELPLNGVKIDRSFVSRTADDEADAALIRLVVDAAHARGLTVIAEGV